MRCSLLEVVNDLAGKDEALVLILQRRLFGFGETQLIQRLEGVLEYGEVDKCSHYMQFDTPWEDFEEHVDVVDQELFQELLLLFVDLLLILLRPSIKNLEC